MDESFKPSLPSLPKAKQLQPDWSSIPSKDVKMSEEEFEEAIRALALADAERAAKMGDAGKGISAGENERAKLLMEYISAVSPDRKSAYENFDGRSDTVYGSSNQKLLSRSPYGAWSCSPTKEELSRAAKFSEVYISTIKEYEDEHGTLPYGASAKVVSSSYSYNTAAYNSLYNALM